MTRATLELALYAWFAIGGIIYLAVHAMQVFS